MLGAIIGTGAVLLIAILGSAWRNGRDIGTVQSTLDSHDGRIDRIEEWQDYYDRDTRGRLYRRPRNGEG